MRERLVPVAAHLGTPPEIFLYTIDEPPLDSSPRHEQIDIVTLELSLAGYRSPLALELEMLMADPSNRAAYLAVMGREWEPLEFASHVEIPGVDSESTRADTRR